MGDWLHKSGEAIYGTKGGPYVPDSISASTRKGNKIYLHLFEASNNKLELENIPGAKIKNAFFLQGNPVKFQQDEHQIILSWNHALPDNNDTVIVLEMDKNVEQLPLINNSTTQ